MSLHLTSSVTGRRKGREEFAWPQKVSIKEQETRNEKLQQKLNPVSQSRGTGASWGSARLLGRAGADVKKSRQASEKLIPGSATAGPCPHVAGALEGL